MFPIRDHNPSRTTPYVTIALIVANVAIFLLMVPYASNEMAIRRIYVSYAMFPGRISAGDGYLTLVTATFLHAGFMHLAGNMLFLWIFGDNLEDVMGHVPFLIFYLLCGVGANLAQVAASPHAMIPTVGASGAIAGVMGGYLLLYPRARIDVLVIIVFFIQVFSVPAWTMLGLWFVLQLFNGAAADASAGGVAYWAHAGGFALGMIFILPWWLRRGGARYWQATRGRPQYPEARYRITSTRVPRVRRRK